MRDVGGTAADVDDYRLVPLAAFGVVMHGRSGGFFKEIDLVEAGLGGGLAQAVFAMGHRTDLAGQADLAKGNRLLRQRPVLQRGQHRQQHRQIGGGFLHADATNDIDEHVLGADQHAAMTVQHRQQHGQAVLLQANGDTARIRQRRGIDQRLHLHQQRPGALAGDHHAAAWLVGPCRPSRTRPAR
ncbi:hypothetical protein G6F66_013910 [Rhizopus arrhizus]|nr:hypothetical protein G6F66_013910 [Rhizopus arrhizus]